MPVEELLGQILRVKGQDVIRLQRGDLLKALRLRRVHFSPRGPQMQSRMSRNNAPGRNSVDSSDRSRGLTSESPQRDNWGNGKGKRQPRLGRRRRENCRCLESLRAGTRCKASRQGVAQHSVKEKNAKYNRLHIRLFLCRWI